MLDVDKVVVLENNEEYLVLDKAIKDDKEYYYIAKVNDTETDIENDFKLVSVEENDDYKIIVEVTGEDRLRKILPMFSKEL